MGTPWEDVRSHCRDARWGDAVRLLDVLDVDDAEPADLDLLAGASYLTGRVDLAFDLWTRAHRRAADRGDLADAARLGVRQAMAHGFRGDIPRARGWVDRSARLLAGEPHDEVIDGRLTYAGGYCDLFERGDVPGAHARFVAAGEIADRRGDEGLAALARIAEGRMLVYLGDVQAGVGLLDEAMVSVEAGVLDPIATGDAYCTVIDACHELFDVARCQTWTDALTRWCDRQQELVTYRGHCFVHRAELSLFHGRWDDALAQAREAVERLADPVQPGILGAAHYLEGEVHRMRGELDAADAAYRRANASGFAPQPGFARLRVAQGDPEAADALIRRVLEEARNPVRRAGLLPALAEIVRLVGDDDTAAAAVEELRGLAVELGSDALLAAAEHEDAVRALAEGRAGDALGLGRDALARWRDLDAPWDAARTRLVLAEGCERLGDLDGAAMERDAAAEVMARLGAVPSQVDPPGRAPDELPAGLTARECEVLRVLARGRTNRAIGEELFIAEKTVASHVSHIFTKLGVTSRSAATAWAFEHDQN